jgi:hypothetical protein
MKRALARRLVAFAIIAFAPASVLLLVDGDAPAQPRGNPPRGGGAPRPAPPRRPPTTADAGAPAPTPSAMPTGTTPPTATGKDATDSGVVAVTRSGDGGSQTIRFGELEIEGRLKSPQLVYFLRRVRAEFAAGDLGHRSFMGELSETRKDPSF